MEIEPVLTFGAYLRELDAEQRRRPVALRQRVPTYKELGELLAVNPMTVYRLTAATYRLQLPLDLTYRLIQAMRTLGFEMGVRDLVSWELPEGVRRPPHGWVPMVERGQPEQLVVILGKCLEVCRGVGEPPLPTIGALATAAQMSRRQLERIVAGTIQRVDLTKLGLLLTALAQAGWGLMPEDVLYYPEEDTAVLP